VSEYFAVTYSGPAFVILGPPHLAAMAAVVVLNLVLFQFRHSPERAGLVLRISLTTVLWSAELSWHLWNLGAGTWTIMNMLPLNTCSMLIWLSGVMLIRKDARIYEFAYFLGIGGALQYLVTPDLGPYGYPHFRFFQAFTSHGLLLTAPIYMTVVEHFRPTWKSLRRVVLWTNAYMVLVFLVNLALGSDYLMLNAKPATPSLLDLLPPWPHYIAYMEVIGLSTCLLLYTPFIIRDRKSGRALEAP
jgi:hypothetical integral membrane protein (TIGR02206 family)